MTSYKLSIPTPCHENWDGMAPNTDGRFCGQCQKTVTDFTGMTNAQVNAYMQLNAGRKICGRFEAKQLDSIIIQIPAQVMYSQSSFRKMFLLALFVTMGTALFSCHQQVMGEPAIVDDNLQPTVIDSAKQNDEIIGKVKNPDSTKWLPPPPLPVKSPPMPKNIINEIKFKADTLEK